MKKILSITLVVAMLVSLFCAVPVHAEGTLPANIATDYTPGAMTGNMFGTTDLTSTDVISGMYTPDNFTATVASGVADSWYVWTKAAVLETTATGKGGEGDADGRPYGTGVAGVFVNKNYLNTADLAAGDGLVVIANVKANRAQPLVKAALTLKGKSPLYPKEYSEAADGYKVTNASSWEKVSNTFKLPEDWSGIDDTQIGFGYPYPNIETADKRIYLQRSSFYIGEEYAYDINVSAADKELFAGKTIAVDADIFNQGGSTGYLDQSVTWYATNADRTETVNGFTFTEIEDGTYAVSVDRTVAAGTYDIVAVSDVNANLVKGIEVTVTEAPSFEDSGAGDVKGNMLTNNKLTLTYNYAHHNMTFEGETAATNDAYPTAQSGYTMLKSFRDIVHPAAVYVDTDSDGDLDTFSGYSYDGAVIAGGNVSVTYPAAATGRVVYSFSARLNGDSKTPVIMNMARRNDSISGNANSARYEYPVETAYNGADKGAVLDGIFAFTTFKGTFADTGAVPNKYVYALGFAQGTAKGAIARISDNAYIGYEYAYDMTVSASDTKLYPGKEITLSADIINQIGNEFGGNTKLNWIAMDANRENTVNGFTFTENEDGTYTATIDETVAKGTYDLVAISVDNNKLIKGVEISVTKNPYADYVPGAITGNMVTNDTLSLTFNYHHRAKLEGETARKDDVNLVDPGNYYYIKAMRDMDNPSVAYEDKDGDTIADTPSSAPYYHHPFAGGAVSTTVPDATKTGRVVFSLQVKNGNSSMTAPTVGIGRRNSSISSTSNPARIEYPLESEYNAENKGFVAGTSYQTFKGTFADTGATPDKYAYTIGLAGGSKSGEIVHILKSNAYIGYEYAHDMKVTSEAETAEQGAMFNVEASVVNQIGNAYGGTETITWKAMSQDRLSEIDGITVTATDNGTAVVEIGEDVVPGTYDIVAVLGDGVMAKGVPVTVTEAAVETIEGITIVKTAGGIVVATDTSLTDAQLIFVTYDAYGKLIAVNNETKVTLSAQGAQEYAIPTGFEAAKVMFFTADFKPLANVLN